MPSIIPFRRNVLRRQAPAGLGLQTNLSAFWEFENTSWTDSSGNGNTLTAAGSPTTVTGVVGNAANFVSGSSQSLNVASNAGLQVGGGSFSIQAWINYGSAATGSTNGIISKNDGGFANREWGIGDAFTTSNVIAWNLYVGNVPANCASTVTIDSSFHHVVITWDGTTQRIYVDNGTPGTNVPGGVGVNTTSSIFIGKNGETAAFATVKVDQVGIWKGRVLSASDVASLYNGGAGRSYSAMA